MQLRQSEPLRIFDHHDAGGGNIDADLDHRGCHQQPDLAACELRHHLIFFRATHLAVDKADLVAEPGFQAFKALRGIGEIDGLGFLNQRANPVDPLSGALARGRPHRSLH